MHSIAASSTIALVVAASITDLRSRRIPNILVLPFLVLGMLFGTLASGWAGLSQSSFGVLLAVAVFGPICFLGGMGMGDLKLCAAVGAWIGPSQLLVALVMTTLFGGIMAVIWAIIGGFLGQTLRSTAGLVCGRRTGLTLANPAARTMPYAPAIALGTIFSFLGR